MYIHIGMNEWVKFDTGEFPHKTWRVHSARCTHAYITQLYIMSIQPVNKAVEHLINSAPILGEGGGNSQCLSYKEQLGGGGGVSLTSSRRKDWAEFYGCIK